MQIFNTDILTFKPGKKYDLIICNPPFFEDDLRSADEAKNAAKHDTTLTFIQLLKFVKEYLKDEGIFWVLLPFHRIAYFEKECRADGFYMNQKLLIKHTAVHPYFRGILILSKKELPVKESELVIKDANGVYTEAFVDLMRGYYLNL